jgi:molybdopterin-guanine dinucleotide biosynthesis protein A
VTVQPKMLMIGATGRNIGKTELATRIIGKCAPRTPVVGIKVTTVRERDGKCPHGGEGCGVCTSLAGNYHITEECDGPPDKDTTRLLAAGAVKVYWLRVMLDHLEEGFDALMDAVRDGIDVRDGAAVGDGPVMVCESNSLRTVVEPGLFLVVRSADGGAVKSSCADVIAHADRIVRSDESAFDGVIDDIMFADGDWHMKMRASAVILAGGNSSRMGRDKSMLPVNGRPLHAHIVEQLRPDFDEVVISGDDAGRFSGTDARVIPDITPGQGPLMGILSALEATAHDLNFVTACDIPEMNPMFIRRMFRAVEGYDGVIPVSGESSLEPLFGIYHKSMIPAVRAALQSGRRKIRDALESVRINYIDLDGGDWLFNLNTMSDFENYVKRS